MHTHSRRRAFVLTLLGGVAISAVLMGVTLAADLHEPHVNATNPGFSEGLCPLSQDGDYGWHFVAPGQSEFVSISVTFQNAGVITSFIADPTPKHAYVYTIGPDTLLGATAVLNPDDPDATFVLSHVCNPDVIPTTAPPTTAPPTTAPPTTAPPTTAPPTTAPPTTAPPTTTPPTTTPPTTTPPTTAPSTTAAVQSTAAVATATSSTTTTLSPQTAVLGASIQRDPVSSFALTGAGFGRIVALGFGLSFLGLLVTRLAKR